MENYIKKKILIVDDEKDIVKILETVLKNEGFQNIFTAHTGKEALNISKNNQIDLFLLDIMLPDMNGLEICKEIRKIYISPIIFLSAKSDEVDRVLGISLGGDDYITKPFSPREVISRINSQFRREELIRKAITNNDGDEFSFFDIHIDRKSGTVRKAGKLVKMTAKEFKLLLYLADNHDILMDKQHLMDFVWGDCYEGFDNTLMVHVSRLREKLEDNPAQPKMIKTYKGLGYKFVLENEDEK
ncbi:MAG: two component transcriptional regulator winged helix family [Fusobacteria bacterium]|nr:MAG: two component transcriptional regulator winged helix family [Fusobacteriota bacterium]KAF0228726.1 MAG: two component transcriptional regulator winged helix [Fusobacteriota bacterium]